MTSFRAPLAGVLAFVAGLTWLLTGVANGATASVTTLPATDITSTSFTGHCAVSTDEQVQAYLVYGLKGGALKNPTPNPKIILTASNPDLAIPVSGLTAGVVYDYQCRIYNTTIKTVSGNRVTVTNSTSTPTPSPTTTTATPTVTPTATPTSTTTTIATTYAVRSLPKSDVTPTSFAANCGFDAPARVQTFIKWGLAGSSLANRAPATTTYGVGANQLISFPVTGLASSTAYEYQCRIYNATVGTVIGLREGVSTLPADGSTPTTTPTPTPTPTPTVTPPAPIDGTTVVAVGDMCERANPATCTATGNIAAGLTPAFALQLGDEQYDTGTVEEYTNSYALSSWHSLLSISRPAIGNHEVDAAGEAPGYCGYFGELAHCPTHYYAYDIDANWRAIVLDSNTTGSAAQLSWLQAELAASAGKNVLAYWHEPRWDNDGTGAQDEPGVNVFLQPLYAAHADVILWGHDHLYARYAKLDGAGAPVADGMRAFTVGTGGRNLRLPAPTLDPGTETVVSKHGVLKLTLGASAFTWEFRTVDGQLSDAGSDSVVP